VASVVQRSLIGLGLIAAITGLLAVDEVTGRGYGVVALSVALVAAGLREYTLMLRAAGTRLPEAGLILAGAAFVALRGLGYAVDPRLHLLEAPLAIAFAYAVFFRTLMGAPSLDRFRALTATAFGFFYLPFLGSYSLDVRFLAPDVGPPGFFYVVAIAKGTDICAFYAGKAFGRVKLVPSVSPGKTTAGFVGAVAGGALITALFSWLTALGRLVPLPLAPGLGACLSLVVISGDLIESFMKRSVDVKDSASLLPGFGGVLDIVDSVVVAAPVVFYVLLVLSRSSM